MSDSLLTLLLNPLLFMYELVDMFTWSCWLGSLQILHLVSVDQHTWKGEITINLLIIVHWCVQIITSNSHNHSMLIYMPFWNMWAESQKCGQKSCSLNVQWIHWYIIITTTVLPTFLRFCPHISESDPPLEKTTHFEAKKLWNGPKKNFVASKHA